MFELRIEASVGLGFSILSFLVACLCARAGLFWVRDLPDLNTFLVMVWVSDLDPFLGARNGPWNSETVKNTKRT